MGNSSSEEQELRVPKIRHPAVRQKPLGFVRRIYLTDFPSIWACQGQHAQVYFEKINEYNKLT